jgi:putative ABC transport system permease protein
VGTNNLCRTTKSKRNWGKKVLGASVPDIVSLLTRDFVILVLISIVIAAPLAWLGIHKWLQDFAYRIHIGWAAFMIAAVGAILIAVINGLASKP